MERYCKNDRPYIYVAFPQEQEEQILTALEAVAADGVQFWYADRFDRREKGRLRRAFGVLLFVTAEFSASERFRSIVDTAVAGGQKILSVYLEDIPSTPWSTMQLGSQQALFADNMDESFVPKLKEAFIFRDMAVTKAQKKYQRNRAITMVTAPIAAAVILFFAVVNPLLIAPAKAIESAAQRWGLTREDLESITELYIVGDRAYGSLVHGWYEFDDRSAVQFGMSVNDNMEVQGPVPVGSLTSEDLEIFSYMPNLEYLCICGNQITDISPLFCLKKLSHLDLSANPISSIEGIGALSNLEAIFLTATDITDPSPLWDCQNLVLVMLDATYVSDISGVERLPKLEHLNIGATNVRDISALSTANKLNCLIINAAPVSKLPALNTLPYIHLDIRETLIDEYSSLGDIESFDKLFVEQDELQTVLPYIEGKPIREFSWHGLQIDSLRELSGIVINPGGVLSLGWSTVSSLDGLELFEGIDILDIHFCQNLSDLTPVQQLQSLRRLVISSDMSELADEQLRDTHFVIEYCDNYYYN